MPYLARAALWAAQRSIAARRVRRVIALVLVLTVAAGVAVVTTIGAMLSSLGGTDTTVGNCRPSGSAPPVIPAGLQPEGLDAEQLATAGAIVAEGQRLGVDDYGLVVAIAAARQESGIRPLTYGHSSSLGPFQQLTAWGPAAERIDTTTSARRFFTGGDAGQPGLLDVVGYQALSVTVAAQTVQRSAYPDAYADDEVVARQIVSTLAGRSLSVDNTAACQVVGASTLPGTQCPDSGLRVEAGLTPNALEVLRCIRAAWPTQITSYGGVGERLSNPQSDHPQGRAVDAMIPHWDTPAGDALGWQVAEYARASAAQWNVNYIIWSARIWSPDRADEGWRPYQHPSGATDPTSAHLDHVHISVLP